MTEWIDRAIALGFDVASPIDPQILVAREDVRSMCADNRCGTYNKNWTCPPAIGSVGECQARLRQYPQGILVQTVGHMTKTVDSRCYRETERRHIRQL